MNNILEILKENYIFAVIRGESIEDAIEISKAAIAGGIKNIEITFSTPNATEAIKKLIEYYKEDASVIIGAGTVMSLADAKEALNAGASYLVSPHFSLQIAEYSLENEVNYFPGCGTVTEIVNAMNAGCKLIKIFPGGILGPEFIKNIHGPIPTAELMPSGGVSIDNIQEWKRNGASAVGIGSALSRDVKVNGYESVTERSRKFLQKIK